MKTTTKRRTYIKMCTNAEAKGVVVISSKLTNSLCFKIEYFFMCACSTNMWRFHDNSPCHRFWSKLSILFQNLYFVRIPQSFQQMLHKIFIFSYSKHFCFFYGGLSRSQNFARQLYILLPYILFVVSRTKCKCYKNS